MNYFNPMTSVCILGMLTLYGLSMFFNWTLPDKEKEDSRDIFKLVCVTYFIAYNVVFVVNTITDYFK